MKQYLKPQDIEFGVETGVMLWNHARHTSYAKEMLKDNNAKDMIDGIIQLFDLNDAVHAD